MLFCRGWGYKCLLIKCTGTFYLKIQQEKKRHQKKLFHQIKNGRIENAIDQNVNGSTRNVEDSMIHPFTEYNAERRQKNKNKLQWK